MIATTRNGGCRAVNRVKLDGTVIQNVIMADEFTGTIVRHKVDKDGCFTHKGDEWVTETLHGKVEIELFSGWSYDAATTSFTFNRRT